MFYRFISDLFEVLKSGDSDCPKRGTYGGATGDCFLQFPQCLKAFPAIWGWTSENKRLFPLNSRHVVFLRSHEISKKRHEFQKRRVYKTS